MAFDGSLRDPSGGGFNGVLADAGGGGGGGSGRRGNRPRNRAKGAVISGGAVPGGGDFLIDEFGNLLVDESGNYLTWQ